MSKLIGVVDYDSISTERSLFVAFLTDIVSLSACYACIHLELVKLPMRRIIFSTETGIV